VVLNPKSNPVGSVPFNQVYSTIVDISENRDFEYEVKWAEPSAWQFVRGIEDASTATLYDDGAPISPSTIFSNGTLSVYVVNELATPSISPSTIKIQVWVGAGSDFALASPTENHLKNLSLFEQQSEVAPMLASSTDASNAPCCVDDVQTFAAGDYIKDENQYLVYQGERVKSFRDLLRRYQYHNSYFPGDTGSGARMVAFNITDFPFSRGWEPGGQDLAIDSTLGNSSYNYCSMLLLNYLTPAFACRRGAIRRKANLVSIGAPSLGSLAVVRNDPGGTGNNVASYNISQANPSNRRKSIQSTSRPGISGMHVSPISVNPCLEYETVFYTDGKRFVPARLKQLYNAAELSHELSIDVAGDVGKPDLRIDAYVSIAEDFQLGMFVGAPILYAYSDPTVA